jgi:hypothetical protein
MYLKKIRNYYFCRLALEFEGFMCTTLDDVKEVDQSTSLFDMAEV